MKICACADGLQRRALIEIPAHWTPEQALAVYDLLAELQDAVSALYGAQIQDELAQHHAERPIDDQL